MWERLFRGATRNQKKNEAALRRITAEKFFLNLCHKTAICFVNIV
jgi:hypothetical protein